MNNQIHIVLEGLGEDTSLSLSCLPPSIYSVLGWALHKVGQGSPLLIFLPLSSPSMCRSAGHILRLNIVNIFQGLHACGNMAFVREFEAFQQYNNDYNRSVENSQSFPDVVGGGDN